MSNMIRCRKCGTYMLMKKKTFLGTDLSFWWECPECGHHTPYKLSQEEALESATKDSRKRE